MKYFCKFIFLLILVFLSSCDPQDGKLRLVNKSNDTIYFSFSYANDSLFFFPINFVKGNVNYRESNFILPDAEVRIPVMDTWEYFINTKCKDSTLIVFFFSKELIMNASRDSILEYGLFTKKEKLKVDDLTKLNWKLVFNK